MGASKEGGGLGNGRVWGNQGIDPKDGGDDERASPGSAGECMLYAGGLVLIIEVGGVVGMSGVGFFGTL